MSDMTILKIFTLNYSFYTWEKSGTLEREIKIYRELEKKYNLNFIFLTYGDKTEKEYEKYFQNSKIIPIYSLVKYSEYKIIRIIRSFFIPFKIRKDLKNISLIKHNQMLGAWIAIILKYLIKKPFIMRTGYDMYLFSKMNDTSFLKRCFYFLLTQITLLTSDIYTVASICDYNFLKKTFITKNNIEVRPNWVEKRPYKIIDKRYKNRIISIGRLEDQKNFKYILEELKDLNFVIDIVGDGEEKKELQGFADKNKIMVNFLGTMKNEELLNLLEKYMFYISASKFEGNPKTVLEALSVGCVVFASNIQNHQELINHSNGYLFNLTKNSLKSVVKDPNKNLSELKTKSKKGYDDVNNYNSLSSAVENEYKDYCLLSKT
ncbi:MAG: hypothetical protein CMA48_00490 [Euryarchaeota archaeon]|nr:hypothetical protein [Euryarchaeota archaeon]|tara:strand:- start:29980 stop:31107 length:1128 start_codon:yes stop_codon:yes gene_type:complete